MDPAEPGWVFTVEDRVVGFPVVLELPHPAPDVFVVRDDHPAFTACGHDLVLAKRERCCMGEGANRFPVDRGSVGLGAVFDDLEVAFFGEFDDFGHLAGPTENMDRDDRSGFWGEGCLYGFSGYVSAGRIDVRAYRSGSQHYSGARCCDERVTWDYDFVAGLDSNRSEREFQGEGAVYNGHSMLRIYGAGIFFLEG